MATTTHAEPLRIGAFSTLCRLSVRMLRYYDAHGVLEPTITDPHTGYRWYDPAQVPDALLVRQLRDIGFSVSAIAALLPLRDDREAFGRALAVQRDQLLADAAEAHRRVAEIDHLVSTLQEETMTTITTTTLPAQTVASLRMTIPNYPAESMAWQAIISEAARQDLRMTDAPCGTIFHDDGYQEGDVDVSVWVPIADGAPVAEPLSQEVMSEQKVIVATVHGPFDLIGPACDALAAHLAQHGLEPVGAMFNRYLVGPGRTQNPDEYVTEVCIPIA